MKLANLMAATALGLSMAMGGVALAQQQKTQGTQQTMPSDTKPDVGTMKSDADTAKSDADKAMRDKTGTGATGTVTTTPPATTGTATTTTESPKWYNGVRVDDLVGKTVRNQADEDVGEIEKIVLDGEGEPHAVLSVGGFLGIGDKEVAIPLSRMEMGEDKVILLSTEDEDALKAMPAYDGKAAGYTEAKGDETLGSM